MNTQNPNEDQLHNALQLSKEKTKLQKEVNNLLDKIQKIDAKIQSALGGKSTPKVEKTPKSPKAPKAPGEKPQGRKGKTKDLIINLLKEASPEGMTLEKLSEATGKDNRNLSVWFSTTGNKMPEITKVGRGTYAYSNTPKEETPAPPKEESQSEESQSEEFQSEESQSENNEE